ncbi:hypothetical protein [Mucilaginibacter xinganensis]|uniref:Uncharacterized protein n=1 Tax=Mucilaginibacter xinganensis TaxID=1234841 RepID=A0A223NYB5_9SPHI|nr:hypothetical protein [Mucilaginibacter xinganensis]ASU34816.1 hypothetical protein MuYL_2929 [Mucilaginibacter xinganensis]
MKKILLFILFPLFSASAYSQSSTDSLAYHLQRKKINTMLEQRALKFGQYDESLKKHTGIFGFQTKKDIRRSNDILMDIVKTDNNIYSELKILLDYRMFQQTQVQTRSQQTEQSTIGYMTTINKLRKQIDILKKDAEEQQQQDQNVRNILIITVLVLAAFIFLMLTFRKSKRPPVKAKRSSTRATGKRRNQV